MHNSVRMGILASTMLAGLAAGASAQELVTADRVGNPDAPNVLTMRTNPNMSPNSPTPGRTPRSRRSGRASPRRIPTGRSSSSSSATTSAASTPACSSRRAPAGRPTASTVDSFQLALFVAERRPAAARRLLHPGGDRRPLPVHPRGHHRHRRPHLCLVVGHRPARPLPQQGPRRRTRRRTWDELQAAALEAARERQGRRALQRRPLGGHHLRLAGELLGAGRRARRRHRQADLRRGREPREDAEGAQLLQGPRRQRRGAEAGRDDQDLRRLQRRGDRRHRGDVLRRPLAVLPAPGGDAAGGVRQVGASPSCPARRPTSARPAPAAGPSPRFTDDPAKIEMCADADARGLHGPGQRGHRRPADPAEPVRHACRSSRIRYFGEAQGVPGQRPGPARACRSTPRSRTRSRS